MTTNETQSATGVAPLSGMTVNERLYSLGLLDVFDVAAKSRDRQRMIKVLTEAQLSEADSIGCADAILNNPNKYGY